jgi:hypothetical protein
MRINRKFSLPVAAILLTAFSFGQTPAGGAAQELVFRAPFDLKLHVDKEHFYQEHFEKIPYVADNEVYLFAGESFGINVTVVDGQISGITYQPGPDKSDVQFKFSQEKSGNKAAPFMMMLATQNHLKQRLQFEALMTIPGKQGAFKTSILPVEPGLSGFESWPNPIVQLVLRNFRFIESPSRPAK